MSRIACFALVRGAEDVYDGGMKYFCLALFFSMLFWASQPCFAAQREKGKSGAAAAEKSKGKKKASVYSPELKKAVSKLNFLTSKRPNPRARFLIYIESGSRCANCNREMPGIVKEYEAIQENGEVDLLLICHDAEAADALAFMKKYGADFPVVLRKDVSPETLPGFEPCHGIPAWRVVATDGSSAVAAKGPVLEDWRKKTVEKKTLPRPPLQ